VVKSWVMLLPLIGLLSACAAVPTGPSVMVLPGVGKPFDQFQADDMLCRQYAQTQTGVPPGDRVRSTRLLSERCWGLEPANRVIILFTSERV
jgi:hypothetical protein